MSTPFAPLLCSPGFSLGVMPLWGLCSLPPAPLSCPGPVVLPCLLALHIKGSLSRESLNTFWTLVLVRLSGSHLLSWWPTWGSALVSFLWLLSIHLLHFYRLGPTWFYLWVNARLTSCFPWSASMPSPLRGLPSRHRLGLLKHLSSNAASSHSRREPLTSPCLQVLPNCLQRRMDGSFSSVLYLSRYLRNPV